MKKIEPLYINPKSYGADAKIKINEIIAFLNTLQPEENGSKQNFTPEQTQCVSSEIHAAPNSTQGDPIIATSPYFPETENTWEEKLDRIWYHALMPEYANDAKVVIKSFISSLLTQTRTEEREKMCTFLGL